VLKRSWSVGGALNACHSAGVQARLPRALHILAALAVMLLSGCAVGPDFQAPPAPDVAGYTRGRMPAQTASANVAGGQAQHFERDRDIPGDWWEVFHSKPLKSLVAQALQNNSDLRAAQAALRLARHNVSAGVGAFFPSIDGSFSATRGQAPLASPDDPGEPVLNMYTGQVTVTYVPDVFGGTRRAVESLQAQADNQRFQLEATYLTLTSNIVLAAVQEASLRGQIVATQKIIKVVRDSLDVFHRQRSLGQIADADVLAEEAALAQIEQTLPPLQRQLEQQRHLLTALIGRLPSEEPVETFVLAGLHLPRDLPVSLPSKLVEQRPDIRAAEANLQSASAQIGVAIANRLPNVTLTANPGSTAFSIDQLFAPSTGFWSISGAVTQPIFQGGTLLFKELAARDAFDQAAAQYRSTVVVAFQNVADALTALRTDADALQKAAVAERAAERSLDITRQRLKLGDINYLGLLNAQQTYQQALINTVLAQANRYADTAALFQALGGGWWNRDDPAPQPVLPLGAVFQ
jgi:NodT family efflux transporter outer membrane factor (OMF) lipoprotein